MKSLQLSKNIKYSEKKWVFDQIYKLYQNRYIQFIFLKGDDLMGLFDYLLDLCETFHPRIGKDNKGAKLMDGFDLMIRAKDGNTYIFDGYVPNGYWMVHPDGERMDEQAWRRYFSNRLKKMMIDRHVTQQELSERSGIPRPMLSNYLNRKATPSFYKVHKIAIALGCSTDEFRYVDPFGKE